MKHRAPGPLYKMHACMIRYRTTILPFPCLDIVSVKSMKLDIKTSQVDIKAHNGTSSKFFITIATCKLLYQLEHH